MDCSGLLSIYNNKPYPENELFASFNNFIFSGDRRVIGKLLYRHSIFQKIKHLPGDIVEVGVFKGSGIATWCKFLDLYTPHTNKKVIGFDIFGKEQSIFDAYKNGKIMNTVIQRVNNNELLLDSVDANLKNANIPADKYCLVEGDVCKTTLEFVKKNPGFRISLLYLDLDLDEPTYETLVNLWDNIVPGGYVLFDEYDYHAFDESNAVDRFLKSRGIPYAVRSTNLYAPSAYLIKE
jgi:hypothetical protein